MADALIQEQDSPNRFHSKSLEISILKLPINTIAGLTALGLELARWANINLRGREKFGITTPLPPEPILSIFQSIGDAGPGLLISAICYEAIDVLTLPLGKKVPETLKVGAACILGMTAIIAHENGRLMAGAIDNGNIPDILGGSLGPIVFAGYMMLLNRFVESSSFKNHKPNPHPLTQDS